MVDDKNDEQEYTLKPPKKRMSTTGKIGLTALVLAGATIVAWPFLPGSGITTTTVETSQPEEFQDGDGSGFGAITVKDAPAAPTRERPVFDPGPIEDELEAQRRALEAQNADLAADVAALQDQLRTIATEAPDNSANQELAEALAAVQEQNAELVKSLQSDMENRLAAADLAARAAVEEERELRREEADAMIALQKAATERAEATARQQSQLTELITQLQRENDALQLQMETGMSDALEQQSERDRIAQEEAARRAELQARQAEAEALRKAQVRSEGVIFDVGGTLSTPGSDGPAQSTNPARPQSPDAAARSFVTRGAAPAAVTTADVIANPSNTILQGTILNATLETAVDSSLPGPIIAMVNYPVYSFDQSQVLIPQGSRLFGQYNSDVSLGQKRIMVGWTRLVTPEGQSVELAAFGADQQGRSGITGHVNNRFGLRFGSAALLSIIGAAPVIAASNFDDEVSEEVAENIADNFADTTGSVIQEFATLPPIISVQPGEAVTVIVDRDLEFY